MRKKKLVLPFLIVGLLLWVPSGAVEARTIDSPEPASPEELRQLKAQESELSSEVKKSSGENSSDKALAAYGVIVIVGFSVLVLAAASSPP